MGLGAKDGRQLRMGCPDNGGNSKLRSGWGVGGCAHNKELAEFVLMDKPPGAEDLGANMAIGMQVAGRRSQVAAAAIESSVVPARYGSG